MKTATITLYHYKGQVTDVIDGDTVKCMVSLGFDEYRLLTIRLANMNAPELNATDGATRQAAQASKEALKTLVLNQIIYFNSTAYDIYKRSIAEIYLNQTDTKSVNQVMVERGFAEAKKY